MGSLGNRAAYSYYMKIKFDSYTDKFRLENALIFAAHDADKIEQIRNLDARRAEQMEQENAMWFQMRMKLHDVRDLDQEIEI